MRLTALYLYPIKSCAGIAVTEAEVTLRGLRHDRRWMVVDENGRFLSQRTLPRMALLRTAIEGAAIRVQGEGAAPLTLPLLFADGPRIEIEVWKHRGPAVRHEGGSAWFTRVLERPAQLVCMPDEIVRPVESEHAQPGDEVSFADGFPMLLVNRASLDALNDGSNIGTDVRRFRPNLVVDGAAAWAEDGWRRLRAGALTLRLPKPCARCSVPGIDPDTAAITREPVRTLARLRTRDHEVYFGVNVTPDGVGRLRVGVEIEVIERVDEASERAD
jgi:uncharacterized protein YcbX